MTESAAAVIQPGLAFEDVEDVSYTLLFSCEQFGLYELDLSEEIRSRRFFTRRLFHADRRLRTKP